jgi:DNA-binding transcriptional regulator YiaG
MAVATVTGAEKARESVGYVMHLPDGRRVYLELPEEYVSRDRSGHLLLRPPAVKILDQVRAIAMQQVERPTPAYLVTLRETLDMTQEEFGEAVGVDKMTVSRWERGSRRPSIANARRIAVLRAKHVKHGAALHGRS